MLHELFVALSGHPSPLFENPEQSSISDFTSESERSLLENLSCLGSLQSRISTGCKEISSSHDSVICRAVVSAILSGPLNEFQERVVEVEASVLHQNPDYVGAYGIVPLSSIARAFDGYSKRLEWLSLTLDCIKGSNRTDQSHGKEVSTSRRSGAQVIAFLRKESHTGYSDTEALALKLLEIAEATWLKQLTTWMLYGMLPSFGREDFFICCDGKEEEYDAEVYVKNSKRPGFVDEETSESIMFIGKSIRHIRRCLSHMSTTSAEELEQASASVLVKHSVMLQSIQHPILNFKFKKTVSDIRSSLSQNALQKLLPITEILKLLAVLREFLLLERGEFAAALIEAADECLENRRKDLTFSKNRDKLSGLMIKEGEVNNVLSRTWNILSSVKGVHEEFEDEAFELARRITRLELSQRYPKKDNNVPRPPAKSISNHSIFSDVLLATPISLSVNAPPPQDLFLSDEDARVYSKINSYLLGIRRAELHLARLWQSSILRKQNRSRPRRGSSEQSFHHVRVEDRNRKMRSVWTSISHVHFFLNQLGNYLQGEIVPGCTNELHKWLQPESKQRSHTGRPKSQHRADASSSMPIQTKGDKADIAEETKITTKVSSRQSEDRAARQDPETIAAAHRVYLKHLQTVLLLDDPQFTTGLRNLMTRADHIAALVSRLAVVVAALQAVYTGSNASTERTVLEKEEADLFKNMASVRVSLLSGIDEMIKRLAILDEEHRVNAVDIGSGSATTSDKTVSRTGISIGFQPWRGASIARLLMRLEPERSKDADEL